MAAITSPTRFMAALMGLSPVRRQSLISFGSSVIVTLSGYIATVIFAHTIGPGPLGAYFLFITWAGLLTTISDVGISGACAKRISEGKDQGSWFGAFLVLKMALLGIFLLFLIFLQPLFVDVSASGLFLPLLAAVVAGGASGIVSTAVYGYGSVGVTQTADLANTLIRLFIQVIAVLLGYSVAGLIGGFFAGIAAGLAVNMRFLPIRPSWFGREHIKGLAGYASWAFLGGLVGIASGQLDTALVGYFLTVESVGFYRTALQFSSMVLFACIAVRAVLFPRISQYFALMEKEAITRLLARSFTYSLLLALPACAGGLVLGGSIVYFLYGEAFLPAVPALSVLLVAQLVSVLPSIILTALSAVDRPKDAFYAGAAGALATAGICWLSIPASGIQGAAVAVLAGGVVSGVLGGLRLTKVIPVTLEWRPFGVMTGASFIMAALIFVLMQIFPVSSVFILILYVIAGTVLYGGCVMFAEAGIREELFGIARHFGIPVPD